MKSKRSLLQRASCLCSFLSSLFVVLSNSALMLWCTTMMKELPQAWCHHCLPPSLLPSHASTTTACSAWTLHHYSHSYTNKVLLLSLKCWNVFDPVLPPLFLHSIRTHIHQHCLLHSLIFLREYPGRGLSRVIRSWSLRVCMGWAL